MARRRAVAFYSKLKYAIAAAFVVCFTTPSDAQRAYYQYPLGSTPTGTEIFGPIRQGGADVTLPLSTIAPVRTVNGLTGAVTINLGSLGGLAAANNLSDIGSASVARTNLGLSALSVLNIGAGLTSSGGALVANLQSVAGLTGTPTAANLAAQLGGTSGSQLAFGNDSRIVGALPSTSMRVPSGNAGAANGAVVSDANNTISGQSVIPAGGTASVSLATASGRDIYVDTQGAVGNAAGGIDDTTPLANSLAACANRGGGRVLLGPKQYLFNSGDLYVPRGCTFGGQSPPEFQNVYSNPTTAPFMLVAGNGHGLHTQGSGHIENLAMRTTAITGSYPSTIRAGLNMLAAYSGTALMFGSNLTAQDGTDGSVVNFVALGFTNCIQSSYAGRLNGHTIRGDCTNGHLVDNSHDWSTFWDEEYWPATTVLMPATSEVFSVTGAADNGAGLIRLNVTLPTTQAGYSPPQTGDSVAVWGIGGLTGAYNRFTITVVSISGTTAVLDLQGSTFSGTYTSGGFVGYDLLDRSGVGFQVTNSEATNFDHAYDFGHRLAFNMGDGSLGTVFAHSSSDMDSAIQDATSIGVQMQGTGNYENAFGSPGSYIANKAIAFNINGSPSTNRPNRISGTDVIPINAIGSTMLVQGGDVILQDNSSSGGGELVVQGSPTSVTLTGNSMPLTIIGYQTVGLQALVNGSGNTFSQAGNPCCNLSTIFITQPDNTTCQPGQIAGDANYIYFCTAADTWKRAALSSY